ncbi:hypothetical protein niasHT_019882 [Heterodera trifolii]|uniref:Fibronectin type-III domain-containing protein n=1 Tax=Heterodera trifolii TaxID=157864 RepID=A0ABD2KY78_9BILA
MSDNVEFHQELREMLRGINQKLELNNQKLDICNQRIDMNTQKIDICNQRINTIQQDMTILKSDVSGLKYDFAGLKNDGAGLNQKLDICNQRIDQNTQKIDTMLLLKYDVAGQKSEKGVPCTAAEVPLNREEESVPVEREPGAQKDAKEEMSGPSKVVQAQKNIEKVSEHVPEAETKTDTIVSLRKQLAEFGRISDRVFDILEKEEKGQEFAKKLPQMRKDCSDIAELKITPEDRDSILRVLVLLKPGLRRIKKEVLDHFKKPSGLTVEANSAIEQLHQSFSALSTAFDKAAKKSSSSRSISPVFFRPIVCQLSVRVVAITNNSIKVQWYPITSGQIDNMKIQKYKLHYKCTSPGNEWSETDAYECNPINGALYVHLRSLSPDTEYAFYVSAHGASGQELRHSCRVRVPTDLA